MSRKKKVLIVSDYIEGTLGGIEMYIHNLERVLPKDDYEIEYFGGKNINGFKKYFYLILSSYNFVYARKFREKINNYKPDIIWFHSISRLLGPKILEELKDYKGKTIMTYHDFGYFSFFAKNLYNEKNIPEKFSFWEFLKKAGIKGYLLFFYVVIKYLKLKKLQKNLSLYVQFHTVPSEFMKKYVEKLGYSQNVEVLPNFILKEQIGDRKNIFQDKINFIFFARLEKEKGIGVLIYFLSQLEELKYKNRKKYNQIISKIRIFIFGDGQKKKELLETFVGEDIYGKDISIIKNLENEDNIIDFIDKDGNKFVYFFGKRDYDVIKEFMSFSHFSLVLSLFLETFGLSALEACANQLVNIGPNKENIKNFILEDYRLQEQDILEDFSKKMFDIIDNFNLTNWEKDSKKSKLLVEKFII